MDTRLKVVMRKLRLAAAVAIIVMVAAAQPRPIAPGPPPPPPPPGSGVQGQTGAGPGPRRPGGGGGGGRSQQEARKEYRPEELATIEGYVRNSVTSEGLSKASVVLSTSGRMPQTHAATTDASGKFTITGIEPGQYRVSVSRNGYVRSDQSGRRAVSPSSTLTLSTSQTIKGMEARLIPHAVITGRITDADGDPVAHANVQLLRYRYLQQGERELVPSNNAQTNDLGEYRLFGIAPGKYFVGVAPLGRGFFVSEIGGVEAGSEGAVATFYPGSTDPSQATPINVQVGGTLQGIDVRVMRARTFRVSGQVTGIPAEGRRDGMVRLVPHGTGGAGFLSMMSGGLMAPWRPDGKFTVRAVPAGSYTVIADSFDGQNRNRGTAELEVGDRNVDNVQITMQPAFEMQGAVRLEGQGTADFANVFVNLQPRDRGGRFGGGGGGGRVEADGKFQMRQLVTGHYDIMVGGLPDNHYVKSVRAGETEVMAEGVSPIPGMQFDVLISPNGGRISGGVVSEKGEPVTSATVVLLAPEAAPLRRLKTATVDQQGQFSLSGIAPGAYFLAALEDTESGVYWEPDFLIRNDKLVEKISIRESATETKTLKVIPGSGQ